MLSGFAPADAELLALEGEPTAPDVHGVDVRLAGFAYLHHRELVADPKGTVRRVYDWLDLELTSDVEHTIASWQKENAMGAKGTHRYTAEQFGLSAEQIRSDYDFYIRHFDVAVEG